MKYYDGGQEDADHKSNPNPRVSLLAAALSHVDVQVVVQMRLGLGHVLIEVHIEVLARFGRLLAVARCCRVSSTTAALLLRSAVATAASSGTTTASAALHVDATGSVVSSDIGVQGVRCSNSASQASATFFVAHAATGADSLDGVIEISRIVEAVVERPTATTTAAATSLASLESIGAWVSRQAESGRIDSAGSQRVTFLERETGSNVGHVIGGRWLVNLGRSRLATSGLQLSKSLFDALVLELECGLDGRPVGHLQSELSVLGACTRASHSRNGAHGAHGRLCGGRSGLGELGESVVQGHLGGAGQGDLGRWSGDC